MGGAVLSSQEESSIALSKEAKVIRFDLSKITNAHYRKTMQFTGIQPFYVLSPTINQLCYQIDQWTQSIIAKKKFTARFNEDLREIEVTHK